MIFDSIYNYKNYIGYPELYDVLSFLANLKEGELVKPNTVLIPDRIFCNLVKFVSKQEKECKYEAHKKYIDVHMIIEGKESIDVSFCDDMQIKSFDENRDFMELTGEEKATVNLINKGDFLICYPEDAHRTAIICQQSQTIKKAIFKIKL